MLIIFYIFILVTGVFMLWRFWFFMRNPNRQAPEGNGFLSPADGYVVYVKKVEAGKIPITIKKRTQIKLEELSSYEPLNKTSGFLIGIFMTAFSVHHNRVPLTGEVVYKYRRKVDNNISTARLMTNILLNNQPYEEDCNHIIENERVTIGIKTPLGDYSLTQIADKWISHIINEKEVGELIKRGETFGMIRFGSQVDIFIPDHLGYHPIINIGDYVYAGKSIIAELTSEK